MRPLAKWGDYYYKVVRAQDDRPVNPNRIRKSIGAEKSFFEDLRQQEEMEAALLKIAEEVYQRLVKNKRSGHTLTLKIKYDNYSVITRSRTLESPIQSFADIFSAGSKSAGGSYYSQSTGQALGHYAL